MTFKEVCQFLREGKYTSVGSYPTFFITNDGGVLSHEAVRENIFQIGRAMRDKLDDGWRIVGYDVNWEDHDLYCDHTGERIESAYAEESEALDQILGDL